MLMAQAPSENAGFVDTESLVCFAIVLNTGVRGLALTEGVTWPISASTLVPPTSIGTERSSTVPVHSVARRVGVTR